MNWLVELRERRVPQFTISYMVGAFGIVQFLEFLEGRMSLSPHLVNLVGLALLLLLPSILVLAWSYGRPGDDSLGRTGKVAIPANLVAGVVLLFAVFQGKELGAVTRTIEVQDENGTITERVVPRNAFRKRLVVYYFDSDNLVETDPWIREIPAVMLVSDLSQEIFLDMGMPMNLVNTLRDAGYPDGHDLPRPLMRKIADDAHFTHFCTGTIDREGETWVVTIELLDAGSGQSVGEFTGRHDDLAKIIDQASVELRRDLGVPESHIEEAIDLPVAELTSEDLEAVREYSAGLALVTHGNDWAGGAPHFEEAVRLDPHFTMAHYLLFAVYQTLGQAEKSEAAMEAAMENLYRVTERSAFLIKSQYYFNIEQDMEKALAVFDMWTRLFPNDVSAYGQLGLYRYVRQDLPGAIAAYERILEIDPSQYQYLEQIADLQRQMEQFEAAEATLKRYIDRFPGRADGYGNLADFYLAIGRLEDASGALDQALLLEPASQKYKLRAASITLKLGHYEEAEAELARIAARSESPRERVRLYGLFMLLENMRGRTEATAAAVDSLYAVLSRVQNPMQADIAYTMALPTLSLMGRPQQMLDKLEPVAERIPEPFRDLTGVARAWALTDLGRAEEARQQIALATQLVDTYELETIRSHLALVNGMIDELDGDLDSAVARYRESVDLAVNFDPMNQIRLATALRKKGDLKDAREAVDKALAFHPAYSRGHLELARIEQESGHSEEAISHLEIALAAWAEASPDYPPALEARRLLEVLKTGS